MMAEKWRSMEWLTEYLGIERVTAYKHIANGRLPASRIPTTGNRGPFRFKQSQVDKSVRKVRN